MSRVSAPELGSTHDLARALLFLANRHRRYFRDPTDPQGCPPPIDAPPIYADAMRLAIECLNRDDITRELARNGLLQPADVVPFANIPKRTAPDDDANPTA